MTLLRPMVALCVLGAVACVRPDYGRPCEMRGGGDGGPMSIPKTTCDDTQNRKLDLISYANTDCDYLVCVRTLAAPPGGYQDKGIGCSGYCSGCCIDDSDCETGDEKRKLVCRNLLLDADFIARLDGGLLPPGACARYCAFLQTDGGA